MDASINSPTNKNKQIIETVWFEGTTALKEGMALCYNWDKYSGTDTTWLLSDARRLNHVEMPSTTNAQWFAGVVDQDHPASSTGQLVRICKPGSVCNILTRTPSDVDCGTDLLTFDVTATGSHQGYWRYAGIPGEGTAKTLQNVDASSDGDSLCQAYLQHGPPSGGVEVVPLVATGAMGTFMVGGTTLVTGGEIASGHNTYTLADPVPAIPGMRKKFGVITTELTAYDIVISPSNGRTLDLSDADIATITFGQAATCLNTHITLEWMGAWVMRGATKTVPALA